MLEHSVAVVGREPEVAWLALWLACVVTIVLFPSWQVIPLDGLWIGLALVSGVRMWPSRGILALTGIALVTTAAVIGQDMMRHLSTEELLEQLPLLAVIVAAMAWQSHRRTLVKDRAQLAAEAERLVTVQRQFLQDASHQLRTPITIALGHAELLAQALVGQQQRDIAVVVGELQRLRTLSERLLLVAAAENPHFLSLAPAELDLLVADVLRRWQPTAARHWRLGMLQPVTALVDTERLGLALDALIENAVRHTSTDDEITLSVLSSDGGWIARIVVEDTGEGIASADIPRIFQRFTTSAGGTRGTGLGLPLVRAVARGHGGDVSVASVSGKGSRFEVLLPVQANAGRADIDALHWQATQNRAERRRPAETRAEWETR